MSICRGAVVMAAVTAIPAGAQAPAPASVTAADYARAERLMGYNVNPLVLHAAGRATWLPGSGDRFWYTTRTEKGEEAVLFDAAARSRTACDLVECRSALTERAGRSGAPPRPRDDIPSPDGKRAAFIRDWNLWVRDVATGRETQLTKDGVKDFGYATDNAGWTRSDRAILVWSPDSKKIATFQQDQRKRRRDVPRRHPGRASRAPRVEVSAAGRQRRHDDPSRDHRRATSADASSGSRCSPTSIAPRSATTSPARRRLGRRRVVSRIGAPRVRVDVARPQARERCASPTPAPARFATCSKRSVATQFESGNGRVNWHVLPASNEVIWFSRARQLGPALSLRSHHRQAQAADHAPATGNVTQSLRIDEQKRARSISSASARRQGRDPYFRHFYRIGHGRQGR